MSRATSDKELSKLNGRQSLTSKTKKSLQNESIQTIIVIVVIVGIVFGFWYGSQVVLNTKIPPALAVVSGSMCIPYDGACDGWSHPFERTYHIGDIIIIQGVNPKDLRTNYPNDSDIIVFHSPLNPNELIVHRIVSTREINGTIYFLTKGDGNGNPWPENPQSGLDPWDYSAVPGVSQDLIVGKVIMRIPWIGWIAIKMQEAGATNSIVVPVIVILIVLLVVVEFIAPLLKRKTKSTLQEAKSQEGTPPVHSDNSNLYSCSDY
jgi:signal peptidase I